MRRVVPDTAGGLPAALQPTAVCLQGLPAPDAVEFALPDGHVCLVVADRSDTSAALVERLRGSEWQTVKLVTGETGELEGFDVPLAGFDEEAVRAALAEVRARHGPVGFCIYLHPQSSKAIEDAVLTASGRARLTLPFLLAKHLQPGLVDAAGLGRAGFVTVTALDGMLGLSGAADADPVAGGVAGLTKTLRLEWPEVYCRAVDLDPQMGADEGAAAIVAEVHDPNHLLAEVGYGQQGRVTLVAGEALQ